LNFYIYANSSPQIGIGHIARQVILAKALIKRGHTVTFVYYSKAEASDSKFRKLKADYCCIKNIFELKRLSPGSVLIIDDYNLEQAQWQHCFSIARKIVFFDDGIGQPEKQVDIVVNMSGHGNSKKIGKVELQGSQYRLIADKVSRYRTLPFEHESNSNELTVSVMLGGNDSQCLSALICRHLLLFKQIKKINVLTLLDQDVVERNLNSADVESDKISVISNAQNLGQVMKKSHFSICAAGGALYEYLCLGVPAIALIVADNQKSALYSNEINCSCITLDTRVQLDSSRLQEAVNRLINHPRERGKLSRSASQLFDGLGAGRIAEYFDSVLTGYNDA
jgi:spore coat polysaccharide biosynthesis predicted glycosyltransferase SpsG